MKTDLLSKRVDLNKTSLNDGFWIKMQELVRSEAIPYQYLALHNKIEGIDKTYYIEDFKRAAEIKEALKEGKTVPVYPVDKWVYTEKNSPKGSFMGWVFQDSDAYKWLEAAAYALSNKPDGELKEKAEEIIDLICAAQLDNGYINTAFTVNDLSKTFTNLRDWHELYCFGHLSEAAVAYYNATGERKLLDAALRFADLICDTFGENACKGYPGHEEAELALVKLYEVTGEKKYLDTAAFFVEERGKRPYYFDLERGKKTRGENYHYHQAHIQPKHQKEAVGHAVRAVYLYSAMANIAKYKNDGELLSACTALMDNIIDKKMYVTGGIGARANGESFGDNYELPNDTAYCETCASIGFIFFARRMLEIAPNAKIAAAAERALYNTVLSGMSEDGKRFFYVNPLEVIPSRVRRSLNKRHVKTVRQKWFGCACCPPNLARLVSSIGENALTENGGAVYVHQYIGGKYKTENGEVEIISDYAENGKVTVTVTPEKPFTLALRIPDWCGGYTVSAEHKEKDGYALIDIAEKCEISIAFEIEPKLVKTDDRVKNNLGKAAVMRGPFVFCAESVDNGKNIKDLSISKPLCAEYKGGVITANGYRKKNKTKITLLPYYKWGNRGENEMTVFLKIDN